MENEALSHECVIARGEVWDLEQMGTDEGSVRDFMPDIRETSTRLVSNLPAGGDTLVLTAF